MGTTPLQNELRFAKKEVEMLEDLLPASIVKMKLAQPCKKDVISSLTSCAVSHFAGHGKSDPADPSKSRLLLQDWQENPLTVEDLIELKLHKKNAWLAYLSACSTGETQDQALYDESIHLITACQLAGFQHFVGSLWEVSDRYSVGAAREVHCRIKDGIGTSDAVALGVHNAARILRAWKTSGSDGGHQGEVDREVCQSDEEDLSDEDSSNGEAGGEEGGRAHEEIVSPLRPFERIETQRSKEKPEHSRKTSRGATR